MRDHSNIAKNYLRKVVSYIVKIFSPPIDVLQNLLGLTIMVRKYKGIGSTKRFKSREKLWDFLISDKSEKVLFIEFGVHEGYSIKYFANKNINLESKFFGFDSFTGLPENWRNFTKIYKANHFDVGGAIPQTKDERIIFHKGWFNKTLPLFLKENKVSLQSYDKVIVHMDADIYSSTLYCLTKLNDIFDNYIVIFDEFPGEETRALYDYSKAFNSNVKYIGYCGVGKIFPMEVAMEIHNQ